MSKDAVVRFRQRRKKNLVWVHGGKCSYCGIVSNKMNDFHFHHILPETKEFGIGNGNARRLEKDLEESKKCILLCCKCHAQLHRGKIYARAETTYNQERADIVIKERYNPGYHNW